MLKQALMDYTTDDKRQTAIPQEEAVEVLQEKYEIVRDMFYGFDYSKVFTGTPSQQLGIIPQAMEHILSLEDGKMHYLRAVTSLSKAFALSVPHPYTLEVRDEVGFFQKIRSAIAKNTVDEGQTQENIDTAIRQIVSKAVSAEGVVDIFAAAGLQTPDISILSDQFLDEITGLPQRNVALELLRKLLADEIKIRSKQNLVQSRMFSDMLSESIRRYQNRSIEAAQVVQELVELAKVIREATGRGEKLGLRDDELAFYDALGVSENAGEVLGDDTLKMIARELVQMVRNSVTVDWTLKESVRARLRTRVKRLLAKYKYPPDKQELATQTVLEQAELLGRDWVGT